MGSGKRKSPERKIMTHANGAHYLKILIPFRFYPRSALRVADLSCDLSLLHETQSAAEQLLAADSELNEHPLLKARVELLFSLNADAMN